MSRGGPKAISTAETLSQSRQADISLAGADHTVISFGQVTGVTDCLPDQGIQREAKAMCYYFRYWYLAQGRPCHEAYIFDPRE